MIDMSNLIAFADSLPERVRTGSLQAGFNLVAQSVIRVHDNGLDTEGNKITSVHLSESGSRVKEAKYSESYAAFRRSRGRQTSFISLELDGILRSAYQVRVTDKGFQTGYFGNSSPGGEASPGQKMGFAEDRHGKSIINPTEEEIDGIIEDLAAVLIP